MANLDPEKLKALVPLNTLADGHLVSVMEKTKIVKFGEGKMIFKRDDTDSDVYWLLEGAVDLLDQKFNVTKFAAGDANARQPLDNTQPHKFTAVTTTITTILAVDRDSLLSSAEEDELSPELAVDDDEEVDWMSELLSSPLFEFIPPANIQTLFSKFEEVRFNKMQPVITQGAKGDYFYVIQKGRAKVERTTGGKTAVLAELRAGDNFGQDALVSDVPRNAMVTMMTNGTLMRLSEPDFESLLMRPVIETVTLDEVREMVAAGDPKTYILDVRNPKEIVGSKIDGSLNVPLLLIRNNLSKLRENAVYVAACDTGKRSALAAYILNEKGFTAYVMAQADADQDAAVTTDE